MMRPLVLIAAFAVLPVATAADTASPTGLKVAAGDWPWWRGPALDNVSPDRVPTTWGPKENVVWRAEVPGRGHSSPAVWRDRVFLTTADADAQSVLAFDRATGRKLWQTVAHAGKFPHIHPKNSHASATPACDGERVFAVFGNGGGLHVTATDADGKLVWQQPAGGYVSEHGYGSSPVLYKGLVIVLGDSLRGNFVAALDRFTGKLVWRTDRKTTGKHGSYASPVIAALGSRPLLIVPGMTTTTAYDPDTGKEAWTCKGPAEVAGCTPAFGGGLVFSSGGFPEKELLAIRSDGAGDVSKSHVVWRAGKGTTYVPSPLYHDGLLYVVSDGGVATCFEAATGSVVWQDRLSGAFTSSPVLAGDHLIVTNEAGKAYVLKAGRTFDPVGTNDLGEPTFATTAVVGGRLFVRTAKALYCSGTP